MRNSSRWVLLSRAACDCIERRLTDDIERRLRAADIGFDHEDEAEGLTPDVLSPVLLLDDGRCDGWEQIGPFLDCVERAIASDEALPLPPPQPSTALPVLTTAGSDGGVLHTGRILG